jgi:hypothetical protein
MASAPIGIPPLRYETPLTQDDKITPDAHRSLLALYNANPLIKVSTSSGAANIQVPLAAKNQNVEITYLKTSADANVATFIPAPVAAGQTQDVINFGIPVTLAAQGSRVRLRSDGVSNWYVAGN